MMIIYSKETLGLLRKAEKGFRLTFKEGSYLESEGLLTRKPLDGRCTLTAKGQEVLRDNPIVWKWDGHRFFRDGVEVGHLVHRGGSWWSAYSDENEGGSADDELTARALLEVLSGRELELQAVFTPISPLTLKFTPLQKVPKLFQPFILDCLRGRALSYLTEDADAIGVWYEAGHTELNLRVIKASLAEGAPVTLSSGGPP